MDLIYEILGSDWNGGLAAFQLSFARFLVRLNADSLDRDERHHAKPTKDRLLPSIDRIGLFFGIPIQAC